MLLKSVVRDVNDGMLHW